MFNTSHDPTLPNVFCFALIARPVTAITHCAFNRTQHESAVSSCTKLTLERVFISVSLRVCGWVGLLPSSWTLVWPCEVLESVSPIFGLEGRPEWLKVSTTACWFSTKCRQRIEESLSPSVIKITDSTHIVSARRTLTPAACFCYKSARCWLGFLHISVLSDLLHTLRLKANCMRAAALYGYPHANTSIYM